MKSNRNTVIVGVPLFLLILSGAVLCRWVFAPPESPAQLIWAIPIGSVIGLAVCLYLYFVWDPKTLTSKGQNWGASGCLLPFAVIGGTVFAKITAFFLSYDFSQLLAASVGIAIYMMFIYMWVQTFRYRHEQ